MNLIKTAIDLLGKPDRTINDSLYIWGEDDLLLYIWNNGIATKYTLKENGHTVHSKPFVPEVILYYRARVEQLKIHHSEGTEA